MAEKEGFEPSRAFTPIAFRERPLQPLEYFSSNFCIISQNKKHLNIVLINLLKNGKIVMLEKIRKGDRLYDKRNRCFGRYCGVKSF